MLARTTVEPSNAVLVIRRVDLCGERLAAKLPRRKGRREKAAERLPDDLAFVRRRFGDAGHQVERFLIEVNSTASRATHADTLFPVHGVTLPDVRNAMRTVEARAHVDPLLRHHGALSVERKVGSASG